MREHFLSYGGSLLDTVGLLRVEIYEREANVKRSACPSEYCCLYCLPSWLYPQAGRCDTSLPRK
jgi:hypothetical protein